ncbi:MAG TPA: MXAN_6640 family putative metalloprotease [Actinomycetota bacterium]
MPRSFRFVALSALAAALLALTPVVPATAGPVRPERVGQQPRTKFDGRLAEGRATALAPTPRDGLTRALEAGRLSEARYALQRALSLFRLGQVRARFGSVARAEPRGATPILRDLVLRMPELGAADRRRADRLLARPTDGIADPQGDGYTVDEAAPVCSANACYHYVTSTADAPALTDADTNGVPDWIDTLSAVTEQTWATEVTTYGYRAPKSDAASTDPGPDGRIDLYVADIGDDGLYGYCTTDDPNASDPGYPYWDVSAYCVVDNDYAVGQFPFGASGSEALQATVAHEFFHAVQFAYDFSEDRWFTEGTATWMEDEVFDAVDDSLQYLFTSQLRRPQVPLDLSDTSTGYVYGAWIWFRFLSEFFDDPTVIREMWELADGAPGGPDRYSLRAQEQAIASRQLQLRWLYADFGLWNAFPSTTYEEGASYPAPPFRARHGVTARRSAVAGRIVLDHLTTSYVSLTPGRGVRSTSKLLLSVDGPRYATGPEASAMTVSRTGRVKWFVFQLSAKGDGLLRVPFGKRKIRRAVLILTNASTRTRCWVDPTFTYSCAGAPKDDRRAYRYSATLIR